MARTTGKLAAPLLCAVLAQQQALNSASELSDVLEGLKGSTTVNCHALCQAAGHRFQGSSSEWSGSNYVENCRCTGKDYQVICLLDDSYKFESCCMAGQVCGESNKPDANEEAMEEASVEVPEITWEDADVDTVPDCPKCPGAQYELLKHEQASVLALHNKMRKAVGTPPLVWNCHLMCQVQKFADKCVWDHSLLADRDGKGGDIAAGENLAGGTDGEFASWMWFLEYGNVKPTEHATYDAAGHFTAVVWKDTKHMACGVCKDTNHQYGGQFLCQYSDHPGNYDNAFEENVPKFEGTVAQYQAAGLDVEKAKEVHNSLKGYVDFGNVLTRFYATAYDGDVPMEGINKPVGLWAKMPLSVLAIAGSAVACVFSAALMGFAMRRSAVDFRSLRLDYAVGDEEDLACSLAEQ